MGQFSIDSRAELLPRDFRLGLKMDFRRYARGHSPYSCPRSKLREGTVAKQSADSLPRCLATDSRPRDSSPAYPPAHSTAGSRPPNASPFSPIRYHPPPRRRWVPASASPGGCIAAPLPEDMRHSRVPEPRHDVTIDGFGAHCRGKDEPPWVPHSCARRATANPCSTISEEPRDLNAPRRAPGDPDKPRSVFAGRLAQLSWRSWPAT